MLGNNLERHRKGTTCCKCGEAARSALAPIELNAAAASPRSHHESRKSRFRAAGRRPTEATRVAAAAARRCGAAGAPWKPRQQKRPPSRFGRFRCEITVPFEITERPTQHPSSQHNKQHARPRRPGVVLPRTVAGGAPAGVKGGPRSSFWAGSPRPSRSHGRFRPLGGAISALASRHHDRATCRDAVHRSAMHPPARTRAHGALPGG